MDAVTELAPLNERLNDLKKRKAWLADLTRQTDDEIKTARKVLAEAQKENAK